MNKKLIPNILFTTLFLLTFSSTGVLIVATILWLISAICLGAMVLLSIDKINTLPKGEKLPKPNRIYNQIMNGLIITSLGLHGYISVAVVYFAVLLSLILLFNEEEDNDNESGNNRIIE